MTKTQNALLTDVRDRLDEESEYQWKDTQLRRWLNEGAKDVARTTECLRAETEVPVLAGTWEVSSALLNDTVRLNTLEWEDSDNRRNQLDYQDQHNINSYAWGFSEGKPQLYTTVGFPPNLKLKLYPIPQTAGTLHVYRYRLPVELSLDGTDGTEILEIPEGWEDVLVDYCESRALRQDKDPSWQAVEQTYKANLANLYTTALRFSDQTGQIVGATVGSDLPLWLIGGEGYGY